MNRIIPRAVLIGALSACVVGIGAAPIWAQERDPGAATQVFSRGRDAMNAEDYEQACALFEESNRLDPQVGTLLNLAVCQEHRGKLGRALEAWRRAIDLADATGDNRLDYARTHHASLAPRVPRLTVSLSPDAQPGCTVTRDGIELGRPSLGLAFAVDPGEHEVVVSAEGRAERRFSVQLKEGESRTVIVAPGRPEVPPSPEPPEAAKPKSAAASESTGASPLEQPSRRETETDNTLAYASLAAGIVGAAVAGYTGVRMLQHQSTVDNHCSDKRCDAEGMNAAESGRSLSTINTAAFAVSVVGFGIGGYLLLSTEPVDQGQGKSALSRHPCNASLLVGGVF